VALQHTDLSFDPRDPYFPVPGSTSVRWGVQIFTPANGYGIGGDSARIHVHDEQRTLFHFDRLASLGQQRKIDNGDVNVEVVDDRGGLQWTVTVRHDEPVKAVKLLLQGLPGEPMRQGWWAPNTGRGWAHGVNGQRFQLDYPGPDWATPWVAAGDESNGFSLSVRNPSVQRHILHVNQPAYADAPIVELVHCAPATAWSSAYTSPAFRLRLNASDTSLDADLDEHLSYVEHAQGLAPWESRTDVPSWLREVALVVTLHGQHWTGHVFNTFPEMAEALRFVAQHIEPRKVLAYLPGWEGRYYYSYPQYRPAPDLGGTGEFAALVGTAKELGAHVMPMFGGHGANVTRYPQWEQAVLRNDTNRYVELLNRPDWDGDRTGEGDQVFLNPGEPGFGTHLREAISAVVTEFGVDAAFFDTVGYWFNDPRFDLVDGYRRVAAELRQRHPELLLAAEGWWDALSGIFPLSQQFFGVDRDLRKPRVLTRYARTTGHLADGTPGKGSTGVHELGFRPRPPDVAREGHIPVVSIADETLPADAEQVAAICRWAQENAPPRH
jgi:hypothetical protein